MKKSLKIAGIGLAVVALIVIGLLVLAKVFITPERIRSTVLPMAREALNDREVELGDIQVSLFSGIRLEDLRVGERNATEKNFVTARRVVMRYQLMPLLARRVVIDEVRLVDPAIRVERLVDGSFNFSDLLEGERVEDQAPEPVDDTADSGPPIDLLVSEIAIENGELIFLDHAVGAGAPYRTRLSGLEFRASDISLDKSFPIMVEAMVNQAPLEIDGRIDPADAGGRADIRLVDFDVTAFSPYFREQLPGELNTLEIDLNLSVEGNADNVLSGGEIVFREISLLPPDSEESLRIELLRFDYQVKADLKQGRVEINDTTANINGIPLEVSGNIEEITTEPRLDIVLAVSELDLNDAVQAIPKALRQPAVEFDPAGVIDMRLHLAGKAAEPAALLREGEIGLREVMVTAGSARPALSGQLLLAGDTVTSKDLVLQLDENRADIDLRAKNLFGETIEVSHTLSAQRFEIDPLLAAAGAPMAKDPEAGEPDQKPAEEIGPIDLPIKVDGAVNIGETVYRGLTMTDFRLRYRLANNVLTVDRLSGNLAEGSFNQTGRIDLGVKGFTYRSHIEVDGVQADPFISAFLPKATGTVFGTLDFNGTFEGRGTSPENLKKQLSGQGVFSLVDGKLTGAGLVQELAGYLDLEELRVMQISKAAGDVVLEQGKVGIEGNFSGSDVRMAPQGTIGLDGNLDLALNPRLSPKLTERLGKGEIRSLLDRKSVV